MLQNASVLSFSVIYVIIYLINVLFMPSIGACVPYLFSKDAEEIYYAWEIPYPLVMEFPDDV